MKKILFLILLISCQLSFAQSKLIKYFNQLPKDKKLGYVISKKGKSYTATSGTGACKIIVDDANGFLEITDSGTGGGTLIFQLAIFKNTKNEDFIGVSHYSYEGNKEDGMIEDGNYDFYFCGKTLSNMTKDVLPDMTIVEDASYFDVNGEIFPNYSEGVYEYFDLPQHGTTITFHFCTKQLVQACSSNDEKACEIISKIKVVELYWKRDVGSFSLKKD